MELAVINRIETNLAGTELELACKSFAEWLNSAHDISCLRILKLEKIGAEIFQVCFMAWAEPERYQERKRKICTWIVRKQIDFRGWVCHTCVDAIEDTIVDDVFPAEPANMVDIDGILVEGGYTPKMIRRFRLALMRECPVFSGYEIERILKIYNGEADEVYVEYIACTTCERVLIKHLVGKAVNPNMLYTIKSDIEVLQKYKQSQ